METMKKSQVAIITSGGGMKCAYSAGVLLALAEQVKYEKPDIFVAASGSVASMFYFLAGQYEDIRRTWTRYLPSASVVRYFPFPTINLDYIIDTLFRVNVPLDEARLAASPTKWSVPVMDTATGDTAFIRNDTWFEPYAVMRAAKALPLLYNGHARLGGKEYMDGDISADICDLLMEAAALGAKRIICITNPKQRTQLERMLIILNAYGSRPVLRKALLRVLIPERNFCLPQDIEVLSITPEYLLPAGLFTRGRREIVETFNMGYDDLAGRTEEVRAFLDGTDVPSTASAPELLPATV
ncbi:MAG TPA: patatin-like phospholipase family protein [Candidatus Paceibacterota bacterium]|nr:patatin-like phospholipase family protein [Candidatus Paceibacterota bacterium]